MAAILTVTLNPAVDIFTSVAKVAPTHKLRCSQERRDAGGGGVNVARVIKRLGGDVLAAYAAGGPIGAFLQQLIDAEGVASLVVPISGCTRESFTVVETDTGREFRFVLPGPTLTSAECAALRAAIAAAAPPRFIVASGSLAPGVPVDYYARLAADAQARGARFVLDAAGAPLRAALEQGVYLVKPNLRELQDLVGAPLSDEAAAVAASRDLIERGGASIVALSRGAQGAVVVSAEEAWRADAISVPVASSVGAGDSFLGGLVCALARGDALVDAFRCALAAGAAALLRPGTELCLAEDVARLTALAQPRRI